MYLRLTALSTAFSVALIACSNGKKFDSTTAKEETSATKSAEEAPLPLEKVGWKEDGTGAISIEIDLRRDDEKKEAAQAYALNGTATPAATAAPVHHAGISKEDYGQIEWLEQVNPVSGDGVGNKNNKHAMALSCISKGGGGDFYYIVTAQCVQATKQANPETVGGSADYFASNYQWNWDTNKYEDYVASTENKKQKATYHATYVDLFNLGKTSQPGFLSDGANLQPLHCVRGNIASSETNSATLAANLQSLIDKEPGQSIMTLDGKTILKVAQRSNKNLAGYPLAPGMNCGKGKVTVRFRTLDGRDFLTDKTPVQKAELVNSYVGAAFIRSVQMEDAYTNLSNIPKNDLGGKDIKGKIVVTGTSSDMSKQVYIVTNNLLDVDTTSGEQSQAHYNSLLGVLWGTAAHAMGQPDGRGKLKAEFSDLSEFDYRTKPTAGTKVPLFPVLKYLSTGTPLMPFEGVRNPQAQPVPSYTANTVITLDLATKLKAAILLNAERGELMSKSAFIGLEPSGRILSIDPHVVSPVLPNDAQF